MTTQGSPRVALLQLFHEANGFSPIPVGLKDFHSRHWCEGDEARARFGHTRKWFGGALQGAEAAGAAVEIGLCTACHPGGSVQEADFTIIRDALLDSLRGICAQGRPDVLLLLLHGALLADGHPMPEGHLAMAAREIVGLDCVIGVTLDFHANIDPLLPQAADVIVSGKLYPHTDAFDRGWRLAELALRGRRTRTRHVLLPLAGPLPRQETSPGSAMGELAALSDRLAEEHGLDDLNLVGGFHFADHDWASMSILATGGTQAAQDAAIHTLSNAVWNRRHLLTAPVASPETLAPAIEARLDQGMVLVADTGDNPGGGGTGEEPGLLPWLAQSGLDYAAGFFVDAALVAQAGTAGQGATFPATIGPRTAHPFSAPARVEWLGDLRYRNIGPMMTGELLEGGPAAILRIGAGRIIVTTERIQAYDIQAFLGLGIEIAGLPVVMVKSSAHFRASYTPLATGGILLCDSRGWSSSDLTRFPYRGRIGRMLPLAALDKAGWDAAIR